MKYQITYEDALKISEAYKNFNFYKTEHRIDDFRIVTFNYFLCEYRYFVKPLEEKPEINAYDMRGVTFIFNKDGSLFQRFLMLPKFFNVNQVEETQIHLIKDKKINNITVKEDGSLIAFMQLPNGNIFAKTQAGFTNEQSIAAMKLFDSDEKLQNYVKSVLPLYTPLFEYVAFDNRIVLKYSGRQLRLIGLRNNETGEYISAIKLKDLEILSVVSSTIKSIKELENLVNTSQDIEGVVVEFEDGQLVKWKTNWYCNLHGIRTTHIFREDYIIYHYLTETLDEVTQELNMIDDVDAFTFIEKVKKAVMNWSNHIDKTVDELIDSYINVYDKDWAKFATDKHRSGFFGLTRKKIETPETYLQNKINYMLNATRHLLKAKDIVDRWEKL